MDNRTQETFRRIAQTEPALREWLENELGDLNQVLAAAQPDVVLRQAQGKAQFARKLIELLTVRRP